MGALIVEHFIVCDDPLWAISGSALHCSLTSVGDTPEPLKSVGELAGTAKNAMKPQSIVVQHTYARKCSAFTMYIHVCKRKYIPSSSVLDVTNVLYGPAPMTVCALTVTSYSTYSSRPVKSTSMFSPFTVIFLVVILLGRVRGILHSVLSDDSILVYGRYTTP